MMARPRRPKAWALWTCLLAAAAVTTGLNPGSGSAWSQTAPAPPPLGLQEPAQPATSRDEEPPASAPAPDNSDLIHDIGKLFEKSLSVLPPLKSPGEAIDDLHSRAKETAKDAGDALSRLAKPSSMVTGRTICPAADGTPDCKAAADRLCQSKGYKEGKSLNADSAETCSAKVYIPGRHRKPGDCRTDNYVTTALCQ
jgi:hypothetical protein